MDRKRILLIDDEATFSRVLKLYLEETGRCLVRTAGSGREGLVAAREFRPDLILLDVIMPDMDGGDVAAALSADASLQRVPVIFLTAVVSREEATTRNGLIGGQLFIAKPVSAKEVLGYIERCLAHPSGGIERSQPVSGR